MYNCIMSKYFFVLGRTPELSVSEIESVFRINEIENKNLSTSKEVAVYECDEFDVEKLNKCFGGIIKIGIIHEEVELSRDYSDIITENFLEKLFEGGNKKVEFGISLYNCNGDENILGTLHNSQFKTTKVIKSWLKNKGIKAHFPNAKERFLSSATVDKNKLLTNGAEILVILTEKNILVGKTLAVQEFEEFSKRDYGRPVRDMRSGVMPPKLARVMINLSEIKNYQTLLDPFCGSGTVLQEAAVLGFKKIFGCDNSDKAVGDTKINLEWLGSRLNIDVSGVIATKQDTLSLSKSFDRESIDAIVTEPYLGPTLHKAPQASDLTQTINELEKLYLNAFVEFENILKKGGKVVMIFPVFQSQYKIFIDIIEKIENLGLKQIKLSNNTRGSLIVGNKFDFVLREIVKFEKINDPSN